MNNYLLLKIRFYLQRRSHNVKLRDFLNLVARQFLPSAKNRLKGCDFLKINKAEEQILEDLHRCGYSDLGLVLDESIVEEIKQHLEKIPCYKINKKHGQVVDFTNLMNTDQLGNYERSDLSMISEVVSIVNDSKILNTVSKYFSVKPTISNINCWWSFSRRERPKEAQFFHRDVDDFKFVKLFIYLTDVTADSGPHVYVEGSHKVNKLIELKRFTDDEVSASYPEDKIISFERPKGSCFIVDTYGIHKGMLPLHANRLLLQVQYSYFPLFVESYEPLTKSPLNEDIDPYVNRLLFTNLID